MNVGVAHAFVEEARRHLLGEYLPKIERCLERLSDGQVWWRANEQRRQPSASPGGN
jgi:hypothetical protein